MPKVKKDCYQFSTNTNLCCHMEDPTNSFFNYCESINSGDYLTTINNKVINGVNITMDCGSVYSANAMSKCGNTTVSSINDCVTYSTQENSCCYYNYLGNKGCIKYDFNIKDSVLIGNVILQCTSTYLKALMNLLFIIIAFILFLQYIFYL